MPSRKYVPLVWHTRVLSVLNRCKTTCLQENCTQLPFLPAAMSLGNLCSLASFDGVNVLLAFDKVFPAELMIHLCNLFNNSADTVVFVSAQKNLVTEFNLHAFVAHREEITYSGNRCSMFFYAKNKKMDKPGQGKLVGRVRKRLQSMQDSDWAKEVTAALEEQQSTVFRLLLACFSPPHVRQLVQQQIFSTRLTQ